MRQAQDLDRLPVHTIGNDIAGTGHDQSARARDATGATESRLLRQQCQDIENPHDGVPVLPPPSGAGASPAQADAFTFTYRPGAASIGL